MSCERCGQGPAAITYTEYSEAGARKLRICATCARRLGFGVAQEPEDAPVSSPQSPPALSKASKLVGILGIDITIGPVTAGRSEPDDPRECPGCGMTGNQLRKEPLFGCPACYDAFHESLDPLFRRIHGAVTHRGRVPGGRTAGPMDVDGLRRELGSAIANENFEEAARLRDRLRQANLPAAEEEPPEVAP